MRATTFPLRSPGLFHRCKNPLQHSTASSHSLARGCLSFETGRLCRFRAGTGSVRTNRATSRVSPGQLQGLKQSDQNQGLRSNGPLRNLLFPFFPGSLSQIKSIPAARQPGAF
jgi:hypothetical protein